MKGNVNALGEEPSTWAWSDFGLELRANGTLRVFARNGQKTYFRCQSRMYIPADVWTHVAVVQNREKCRLYLQGALEVEKAVGGSLVYPGKGASASRTIESPHPYNDNSEEYVVVDTPGALSFTITFDERTKTESNYGGLCSSIVPDDV